MFEDVPKLEQVNSSHGRYYLLDGEETKFRSVTTVIWETRRRVPSTTKAAAAHQKRMMEAAQRGTQHHTLVERHLLGASNEPSEPGYAVFLPAQQKLDQHLRETYGIEQRLFSRELRAAGTADLICSWDGAPTIVDLKTTSHPNNLKSAWLFPYYCQLLAYREMVKEMVGVVCNIKILYSFMAEDGMFGEPLYDPLVKHLPVTDADEAAIRRLFRREG